MREIAYYSFHRLKVPSLPRCQCDIANGERGQQSPSREIKFKFQRDRQEPGTDERLAQRRRGAEAQRRRGERHWVDRDRILA